MEAQSLFKMSEKVDQYERRQEIHHLLVPRVLNATNVHVQVRHDDRVSPWEAVEHPPKIVKMIKIGREELLSNYWGPLCARKDFAAHHLWPVEAHGYNNP